MSANMSPYKREQQLRKEMSANSYNIINRLHLPETQEIALEYFATRNCYNTMELNSLVLCIEQHRDERKYKNIAEALNQTGKDGYVRCECCHTWIYAGIPINVVGHLVCYICNNIDFDDFQSSTVIHSAPERAFSFDLT